MTNFQVYKKTLPFSFILFLISLVGIAFLVGAPTIGYFIANDGTQDRPLIGLGIGLVVGIVIAALINYLISNRVQAGQIAMMTKGVADDELPDHVVKAGMGEVKGRFAKITAFFVVTGLIKGVFRQIGRAVNKLGTAIGGDTGNAITSTIDSAVQILIGYLCDCCLGWVMYRKDKGVAQTACEGAVIFFKHGKTLIRNIGRIFGMGFLSFALVGGGLFGIFFLIFNQFPNMFVSLSQAIIDFGKRVDWKDMPEFVHDPKILMIVVCAIAAIILWSSIHAVVMRPFILVGVLRNFIGAALQEKPTEEDFKKIEQFSPKFSKLRSSK